MKLGAGRTLECLYVVNSDGPAINLYGEVKIGRGLRLSIRSGTMSSLIDFEIFPHEHFMKMAIDQAKAALAIDEVPVGAVIQKEGRVIGAAHNLTRQLRDPTAHAEMLAITQAAEAVGDWRLTECIMYVTLEPCPMCAGAILNSRLPHVVYGAQDPKGGAVQSLFTLLDDPRLNHRCETAAGVLGKECGQMLTDFFRSKRIQAKDQ